MDYPYIFMFIKKHIKYIVAPIVFCFLVIGLWFWQDRAEPFIRIIGLALVIAAIYLYNKFIRV